MQVVPIQPKFGMCSFLGKLPLQIYVSFLCQFLVKNGRLQTIFEIGIVKLRTTLCYYCSSCYHGDLVTRTRCARCLIQFSIVRTIRTWNTTTCVVIETSHTN